jgi:transcriptional regulator with XRE-family HTH domain
VALNGGGYTKFTNEEIGKYLTDNPNVDIAAATKQFNADPVAVNQYISGLASGYTDPTATKGGSGTAGIYNQMKAQGIDPSELYAATTAIDPNYATQGWSQADIAEQYNLHKGAYALSDQLKGNVADKDWAKFMDANNYSVLDAARAFGLSTDEVQRRYDAAKRPVSIADARDVPGGVGGVNAVVNYNDTITQGSAIPGATSIDPTTGAVVNNLATVKGLKDLYTAGGGSLGYTSPVPTSLADFNKTYVTDRMSGDSLAAYEYLSGKKGAAYPTKSGVGQIARPYDEAVLGYPTRTNLPYIYNKATGKMDVNPDYVSPRRDDKGNVTYSMSANEIKAALNKTPLTGQALYDWAKSNNLTAQQIADATGQSLSSVYAQFRAGSKAAADKAAVTNADGTVDEEKLAEQQKASFDHVSYLKANPDVQAELDAGKANFGSKDDLAAAAYAHYQRYGKAQNRPLKAAGGGMMGYAIGGGLGSLGGYSDGGRLLKGPGDGVSDSIPATIGRKQQPARLADGEFVIPARIVSELGNGSTDAGAKKLYAMMDRVQRARGKTTGKNKVAANSRADKYLPA